MAIANWSGSKSRMALASVSPAAFALLCGLPYVRWMADPSLFDDDFPRVGSLRRSSLADILFRPFNEHMAPLFETVSWLAWQGSGRRILAIPMTFAIASMIAFGVTVGLLAALVRRELRSTTASLVAVAIFCLSSVSAETVLWYSASSFQWAASASLAAWLAASMGIESPTRRGRVGWLAASGIAALLAPAFSAIGVLAGPLATLRVLSAVARPEPMPRRLGWSVLPMLGTVAYLLICERFRYGDVVSASVHRNFSPGAALWAAVRAPSAVLMPGLFGLPNLIGQVPGVVLAASTMVGLLVTFFRAARSQHRPLIVGGVALIVGGYLSTYATRARPDDDWIFETQRYHLFPQIGLVCLIAAAVAPRLRRLDLDIGRGLFAAACLAAVLAIPHYPRMQAVADKMFRFPDQSRALAATFRLEKACDREGITLPQAMMALDPIQTRWFPHVGPFNPLLHLLPTGPTVARLPDRLVRPTLIASMSPEDRESLFGGMEATRYRMPASCWAGPRPPIDARAVADPRVTPIGGGRYRVAGWPGEMEFEVGPEADDARALCLPGLKASRPLEIWWTGEDGDWSTGRSARWNPDPEHPGANSGVAIDSLPHWRRGEIRWLRLIFRDPSPIDVAAPRFLP